MRTKWNNSDTLTQQLRGCQVSHVSVPEEGQLHVHFGNGTILALDAGNQSLTSTVITGDEPSARNPGDARPTGRQLDYLRFIERYGRAPAESDIQHHFLVSAPTVNQMMQTLERRGFVSRLRGVARSIRLNITLT